MILILARLSKSKVISILEELPRLVALGRHEHGTLGSR
jgi:hypothetical protein